MSFLISAGQTLFVAGTDTGVGKTFVSAVLASQALTQAKSPVTYYKPVQTGVVNTADSDAHYVQTHAQSYQKEEGQLLCGTGYTFEIPAAPYVADTEKSIRIDKIRQDIHQCQNRDLNKKNTVIIEGAGGLLVPLIEDWLMIDLIKRLGVSVVLVTTPELGMLNHTLLSIEALQKRLINIQGVVINRLPEQTSEQAIRTMPETLRKYMDEEIPVYYALESSNKKPTPESITDNLENMPEVAHV